MQLYGFSCLIPERKRIERKASKISPLITFYIKQLYDEYGSVTANICLLSLNSPHLISSFAFMSSFPRIVLPTEKTPLP